MSDYYVSKWRKEREEWRIERVRMTDDVTEAKGNLAAVLAGTGFALFVGVLVLAVTFRAVEVLFQ